MLNSKFKINQLIQLVAALAGACALLGGWFLPPEWKEIVSGIGTALLAGSFVGFFDRRYLADERADMRKEWGLADIYRTRTEIDEKETFMT